MGHHLDHAAPPVGPYRRRLGCEDALGVFHHAYTRRKVVADGTMHQSLTLTRPIETFSLG
jgi:hypothetical protein